MLYASRAQKFIPGRFALSFRYRRGSLLVPRRLASLAQSGRDRWLEVDPESVDDSDIGLLDSHRWITVVGKGSGEPEGNSIGDLDL